MQTIGLQATFDLSGWTANYNTYIANVLKASQTTTSSAAAMGASATRMGATWDAVASRWRNTVTGRFTDGAGEASRSLTGLGSVSQSASVHVNTLGLMGTAAAHALGNILAQGAQAAMQSLMNLGAVGLESVAHFEGLIMSSRAMTAQQLMNADATLSMEDALAQAGPIAAQLAHWQERLAILSPFGQKDVEAVFNLAQAYQLNNDQAARMTLGVVNFGAAVHASGPMLERMALALGQVNTAGRLTGMELRQLTEARVPVLGILSKALNKTTAEIKQMVSDGLVPSDVALNAIMEHFEKYGNAAADQANSFGGLMASLADLGPMLTRNLLGPIDDMGKVGGILGALQPHLAELVSTLSSDSFNEGLAGMSNTMAVYAENAFSWGENIVNQLANGMYAAMSAVFDALANIGNYIAYWLAPGSPPRILPDIDQWGADTMSEWIGGFSNADFGTFDELSGTLEKYLRSLGEDVVSKEGLVPLILGSREAIAAALSGVTAAGAITGGAIEAITASLGAAGAGVQNYIDSMLQLAAANESVAAAQGLVDSLTAEYNALLKPIDDELNKIDDAQKNFADTNKISQLEMLLQDPNATAAEKEQARLKIAQLRGEITKRNLATEKKGEIEAAKAALEAEKQKQLASQANFNNQKKLIELQMEQNKLVQEQIKLLAKAGGGGGGGAKGGGGSGGGPKPGAGAFKGFMPELPTAQASTAVNKIMEMVTNLQAKFNAMSEAAGKAWASIVLALEPARVAFEDVKTAVANLGLAFAETAPKIQAHIANLVAYVVTQFGITLPGVFRLVSETLNRLADFWRRNHETILMVVNAVFRLIVGVIAASVTVIVGIMRFMGNWMYGTFKVIQQILTGDFAGAWDTIVLTVSNAVLIVIDTVQTALNNVLAIVGSSLDEQKNIWQNNFQMFFDIAQAVWNNIVSAVSTALTNAYNWIMTTLTDIWTVWSGNWANIQTIAQTTWDSIVLTVSTAILSALKWIEDTIADIKKTWETNFANLQTIAETVWKSITTTVSDKITEAQNKITEILGTIKSKWEEIWNGVNTKVSEVWTAVVNTVSEKIEAIKTAISNQIAAFTTLGGDLINGIKQGIIDKAGAMVAEAVQTVLNALAAMQGAIDGHSPSQLARKLIGQSIGQGVTLGIADEIAGMADMAGLAMDRVVGAMSDAPALAYRQAQAAASYSTIYGDTYNLTEHYNAQPNNPARTFKMMQALAKR